MCYSEGTFPFCLLPNNVPPIRVPSFCIKNFAVNIVYPCIWFQLFIEMFDWWITWLVKLKSWFQILDRNRFHYREVRSLNWIIVNVSAFLHCFRVMGGYRIRYRFLLSPYVSVDVCGTKRLSIRLVEIHCTVRGWTMVGIIWKSFKYDNVSSVQLIHSNLHRRTHFLLFTGLFLFFFFTSMELLLNVYSTNRSISHLESGIYIFLKVLVPAYIRSSMEEEGWFIKGKYDGCICR